MPRSGNVPGARVPASGVLQLVSIPRRPNITLPVQDFGERALTLSLPAIGSCLRGRGLRQAPSRLEAHSGPAAQRGRRGLARSSPRPEGQMSVAFRDESRGKPNPAPSRQRITAPSLKT